MVHATSMSITKSNDQILEMDAEGIGPTISLLNTMSMVVKAIDVDEENKNKVTSVDRHLQALVTHLGLLQAQKNWISIGDSDPDRVFQDKPALKSFQALRLSLQRVGAHEVIDCWRESLVDVAKSSVAAAAEIILKPTREDTLKLAAELAITAGGGKSKGKVWKEKVNLKSPAHAWKSAATAMLKAIGDVSILEKNTISLRDSRKKLMKRIKIVGIPESQLASVFEEVDQVLLLAQTTAMEKNLYEVVLKKKIDDPQAVASLFEICAENNNRIGNEIFKPLMEAVTAMSK